MASTFQMHGVTGEPLTRTASPPASSTSTAAVPSWATDLLSRPSISVRQGIAWGFDDPTEDSDVLVLTSESGLYVDIRFAKANGSQKDTAVNWAFAGNCDMTVLPGAMTALTGPQSQDDSVSGFPCMAHGKWDHIVDSDPTFTGVDEGDIFLLANGDSVEIGIMPNPKTGKKEMYKEYWTAPKPTPSTLNPCVVARMDGPDCEGFLIRIGDFSQGIVRSGSDVWLERWSRSHSKDDPWDRDPRSKLGNDQGSVAIPSMWIVEDRRRLGDRIEVKGRTWEIVEVYHDRTRG